MSSYVYYCKSEKKLHYEQLIFTGENLAFFISEEERFSGEIFDRNNSNHLKNCTLPQVKLFSGLLCMIWGMR